jgi:hypothetical protein
MPTKLKRLKRGGALVTKAQAEKALKGVNTLLKKTKLISEGLKMLDNPYGSAGVASTLGYGRKCRCKRKRRTVHKKGGNFFNTISSGLRGTLGVAGTLANPFISAGIGGLAGLSGGLQGRGKRGGYFVNDPLSRRLMRVV